MDEREIRLRCIEAATKTSIGTAHHAGPAAGVLEAARLWLDWIIAARPPLGLPEKKK